MQCLYLEFWNRYARFLERSNEVDKAREVLKRGAEIFLKHRPAMHILRAAFEEMLGNLDEARTIYELLIHRVGVVDFFFYVFPPPTCPSMRFLLLDSLVARDILLSLLRTILLDENDDSRIVDIFSSLITYKSLNYCFSCAY